MEAHFWRWRRTMGIELERRQASGYEEGCEGEHVPRYLINPRISELRSTE